MTTAWHPSEVKLILKAMFLMLSDEFCVAPAEATFLKEVAGMGSPFNTLDYTREIDGYVQAYTKEPHAFMRGLLAELASAKLDELVVQRLISFAIGILDQGEKTYERLTILKCLRAQFRSDAPMPPEYERAKNTPLSLEVLNRFLERDMIDEATLFRISNEHQPVPPVAVDGAGGANEVLPVPQPAPKWWHALLGKPTK